MAYRDRTLLGDIKKNIIDVGVKGDITQGDKRQYAEVEKKPEPFITYPKKQKKKDIESLNDFQIAFMNAYEKATTARQLPVKYTSKGALKALQLLHPLENPLLKQQILKDYKKEREIGKRDYIEGYTDIATGILRAGDKFVKSASEFVLMPLDYAFNTDFINKFNDYMDESNLAGEESETFPGAITQLMAEYAIPVSTATKIMKGAKTWKQLKDLNKYMGTSKASKIAKRMAEGAFVLGFAEPFVERGARPDMRYGINWKIPFTDKGIGRVNKPIDTKGLTGRELAKATFINKIRFAKEGTMVGGGFPLALSAVGSTIKGGLKLTSWGMTKIAKPLSLSDKVLPGLAKYSRAGATWPLRRVVAPMIVNAMAGSPKLFRQLPPYKEWQLLSVTDPNKLLANTARLDKFLNNFKSFGQNNVTMGTIKEEIQWGILSKARRIKKGIEGYERAAYQLVKDFEKRYNGKTTSPVGEKYVADQVMEYLKGQRKLSTLPKELRFNAEDMKQQLDGLRKAYGNALPTSRKFADFKKQLLGDTNQYMRASFATFTNPYYAPLPKVRKDAVAWILDKVVTKNKDLREAAYTSWPNMNKPKALERYAERTVDNILHTGASGGRDPIEALRKIGFKFLRDDKYQFLKKGEDLPQAIRKLLGQETNLKSQILTTMGEMLSELYTKRGYDTIARILSQGRNPRLFKTEELARPTIIGAQKIGKIPQLGVLPSELEGMFASQEMVKAIQGVGGVLDKLIKASIYRHLMQFKLGTQMGKTVFSPQTQVRNVYSAGTFPLIRGHIGGRASVPDSFKIVLDDIFPGKGINEKQLYNFIEKEIRLGTMDENIITAEMGSLLRDLKSGSINTLDKLFNRFSDTKFVKTATKLYAGGDSGWKIYGRQWVKSQLTDILPTRQAVHDYAKYMGQYLDDINPLSGAKRSMDDLLDEVSAFEIRNTYPTYRKVPPVIKGLRKLPVGNFIAFPAEIVRNAVNIMDFSLKQAAHMNPRIRQMGYRGLMGAALGFGGLGAGIVATAQALTGTSAEQWEAYQRSYAADWNKNANLVAMTGLVNGKGKAFNFSYFSPYDILQKPFTAALRKADEQNINPEATSDYVLGLMFAKDGPMMELLAPFLSEQLGLEALLDVQPGGILLGGRGGVTADGRKVYSESDSISDKFEKSFMHLMNAIEPGAVSTYQKLKGGIEEDVSKGGQPINLKDELIALFGGVRVIQIDVLKNMEYKIGDFQRELRAVDDTEKIYSPQDFQNRGPEVILQEFDQMQQEGLRIQGAFYQKIQDARTIGVNDFSIRAKLKEQGLSRTMINNLMRGIFTPINYSDKRFKKKVTLVKELARQRTAKDPYIGYIAKESYLYPKLGLNMIKLQYQNERLGGEAQESKKDLRWYGILNPLDWPQRIKNLLNPLKGFPSPESKIQTPPLPQTPMPKVANIGAQQDPQTGLTRSESALLSPSEQEIARRT